MQIQAGAIDLNGVAMPALETQNNVALAPSDVAAWINGSSKVTISDPTFSGFSAVIGGVAVSAKDLNPTPNDLQTLASDLQAKLREADLTDSITVGIASNGADLEIQDALGRTLSNVVLTPNAGLTTGGNVTVKWVGRPGVKLQTSGNITGSWASQNATDGSTWTGSTAATSDGTATVTNLPTSGSAGYFRLVKPN
jgi:hypothetical protein